MFQIKKIAAVASAVAVTSVLTVNSAFAAVDLAAIESAQTDVTAVGGAVLGVIIAAMAFKYVRKAL